MDIKIFPIKGIFLSLVVYKNKIINVNKEINTEDLLNNWYWFI